MPIIKLSVNDQVYEKLSNMAKAEGVSIQDLLRSKALGDEDTMFTPADAVQRVFAKYNVGDLFTIPELYGEEWAAMKRGVAGVFGKQFFTYVTETCPEKIMFVGMTNRNRHAQYKVVSK